MHALGSLIRFSYFFWNLISDSFSVPLKFLDIGPPSPQKIHLDASHVELPPESPDSIPKPKYLELIYNPEDNDPEQLQLHQEQEQQQQQQPQPISQQHEQQLPSNNIINNTSIISSGYEIPITDFFLKTKSTSNSKMVENNLNRNIERLIQTWD